MIVNSVTGSDFAPLTIHVRSMSSNASDSNAVAVVPDADDDDDDVLGSLLVVHAAARRRAGARPKLRDALDRTRVSRANDIKAFKAAAIGTDDDDEDDDDKAHDHTTTTTTQFKKVRAC